ncbi:MAG: hypothetical protein P8P48_07430 [Saprospiraceae bacterium]|nr:hypothetical protein [Saprospiraceae bacterium]
MKKSLFRVLSFFVVLSMISCGSSRNALEIDSGYTEELPDPALNDTDPRRNSQLSGKKGFEGLNKGSKISKKKKSGNS